MNSDFLIKTIITVCIVNALAITIVAVRAINALAS